MSKTEGLVPRANASQLPHARTMGVGWARSLTFEMVELCNGYLGRVVYYRCDVVEILLADVGHTRRAKVFLYGAVFQILYVRGISSLMKETAVQ